ncbi:hypothetical protein C8J57DRAFT_1245426 [Mycena rebaudengoi]|nr:hypothetical protein C8J57DRAFT_1245426 [Mycena rebaudengoi]
MPVCPNTSKNMEFNINVEEEEWYARAIRMKQDPVDLRVGKNSRRCRARALKSHDRSVTGLGEIWTFQGFIWPEAPSNWPLEDSSRMDRSATEWRERTKTMITLLNKEKSVIPSVVLRRKQPQITKGFPSRAV